jgi:cytochrome b561
MWKSTDDRYGRIAISIHWISAFLIVGMMIAGFRAAAMTDLEAKASLLRIQASLGIALLILTLARIGWWLLADRRPKDPKDAPRLQMIAAKAVHVLLYAAILGLAFSGIALFAMSGTGAILFGNAHGPLPDFWNFAPRYGHAAAARLMALLLLLHTGAAFYHQFILKDRLFARMGIGQ